MTKLIMAIVLAWMIPAAGVAQADNIKRDQLSPARIQAIVKQFAANETQGRQALKRYTFHRSVVIQSISTFGGQITGEYHRESEMGLDGGSRTERIERFPVPTLRDISFAIDDLEEMTGGDPFALDSAHVDQYDLTYLGTERIDEITTFVFDVAPKPTRDARSRSFKGRVWVDDRDMFIVKTRGHSVPRVRTYDFPAAEAYREEIDGKYWLPTYVYSNEQLALDNGRDVTFRARIKYTDFKVK